MQKGCLLKNRASRYISTVAFTMVMSFSVSAESLLMGFDEYMDRCMSSFGQDKVTRSVCENQYKAIEQKEQEIFAQTNDLNNENWLEENKTDEKLSEKN
ncbi:hypothetical protein C9J01_03310 [Photobacterium rosenbergii]|uniref:DUF1311 domain-containing protein n=2 Tax=Photobacterium rosenbergii TaxID=294936 RepID=A0A2T3NKP3_9GAMM|nr:hypothetical protein C9J01_03310 [Photobacterium rosenbergii]